jgi:hypothetical protein
MIPPLPPLPGTPMDASEYRFWKELERLRKVAGIESPWYTPAFRAAAVAMRKASNVAAGRCSPNPGRWPRTRASRKFVRRLVESLRLD